MSAARVLRAARVALEARAGAIDDLNVFPVADGDTGANMLVTARAAESAAAAGGALDRAGLCDAIAAASLAAARGNSGMILSQMIAGAAARIAATAGPLDGPALAAALRAASRAADAAVRAPVEGTMLTVARGCADGAEGAGAAPPDRVLAAAVAAGREALARTPSLLPVLAEAGVVDSGGLGVMVLLEGAAAELCGRAPAPPLRVALPPPRRADHPPSRFRYCTTFMVHGADIDALALEAALAEVGDSVLVVGDPPRMKVHVHTDAPERAAALGGRWGEVAELRHDDMRRQEAERRARLAARRSVACVAVVIADGAGVRALAEDLGARARPSGAAAAEIAAATGDAPEAVIVVADPVDLPAARAAAEGTGAVVVDAGSLPAALTGLVELDHDLPAAANAARMAAAASRAEVTAVDGDDPDALRDGVRRVVAGRAGDDPALVTILVGARAGVTPDQVEAWARAAGGDVEVEAHLGGQARPALAVAVE
ncbi:MAG: DAK2 domain-containing protein [Thermoleophilia bacterium]